MHQQKMTVKDKEVEQQMKDRERILKAKDYAEKQRKLNMKNKKSNVTTSGGI